MDKRRGLSGGAWFFIVAGGLVLAFVWANGPGGTDDLDPGYGYETCYEPRGSYVC